MNPRGSTIVEVVAKCCCGSIYLRTAAECGTIHGVKHVCDIQPERTRQSAALPELYPLTFLLNIHNALWGRELWEISGLAQSPSIVASGALEGRALDDLASAYGAALTGTKAPRPDVFPLLFKVIEAKDRLSVQVHPAGGALGTTRPPEGDPKTEMWYVLGGQGRIFAGLKPGTDAAQVEECVRTGRFEELLVQHEVHEGEVLFIPGGTVHAIGGDVTVYEVQQSSDTTYRLYDWGRVGTDGKPRQLHVEEALRAIDFDLSVPQPQKKEVTCPYFKFRSLVADGFLDVAANPQTFTALYMVDDGRSVLVPANCSARIACNGRVLATTL